MKKLFVTESPSKVSIIEKKIKLFFPNDEIKVVCTKGHLYDLSKDKNIGLIKNKDNTISFEYKAIYGKKNIIETLTILFKQYDEIYLITDPDREGEIIAFLLYIKIIKFISTTKKNYRLLLYEITEDGIKQGLKNLTKINLNLVRAQQLRRAYDRLYGFNLSIPMSNLFKKTGIGRVQTPVLIEIFNREKEIKNFVPKFFYKIVNNINVFVINLVKQNKNLDTFSDKIQCEKICNFLNNNIQKFKFKQTKELYSVYKKNNTFDTASLLSKTYQKFGYSTSKTMLILQKLYESGYITYPRTDSKRISDSALQKIIYFIEKKYGVKYLSNNIKKTKLILSNKQKFEQSAHECIRPTDFSLDIFEKIQQYNLTKEEKNILLLILKQTLTVFMSVPKVKHFIHVFDYNDISLLLHSYKILFDGRLILDSISVDKILKQQIDDVESYFNNVLQKNIVFKVIKSQTKPKHSYYNNSSLIKFMKNTSLGRPSTYSYIISILLKHKLIRKEGKVFRINKLGECIVSFLEKYFINDFNPSITVKLEKNIELLEQNLVNRDKLIIFIWDKILDIKNKMLILKKKLNQKKIIIKTLKCYHCKNNENILLFGFFGQYLSCTKCHKTTNISNENLILINNFNITFED